MSHLGQRISALIDGELSDSERDRVLTHIAGCDACRQEAVALRALKQRMHSLGEAMVDAALTGRLMAMAIPPDARPPWRPRGVLPATRMLTAGILASAVAGLGAAAFFAGGEQQVPGPKVTPAVDTFLVQHAIVTGDLPVTQASGTAASGTAASGTAASGTAASPRGSATAVPATRSASVAAGVSASAVTGAAAAASAARAGRQSGSRQSASGQSDSGQSGSRLAAGMMRLGLQKPLAVATSPVPGGTATATVSASPGP